MWGCTCTVLCAGIKLIHMIPRSPVMSCQVPLLPKLISGNLSKVILPCHDYLLNKEDKANCFYLLPKQLLMSRSMYRTACPNTVQVAIETGQSSLSIRISEERLLH